MKISICRKEILPKRKGKGELDFEKGQTGFIRSGKVRGKGSFLLWSGKLAVVRGKIVFSFCRSGKSFIFHHQRSMYNTLITR